MAYRRAVIYYQTLYPESLRGELLDRFLAAGWYRIGQSCVTTDLILQAGRPIPVFWLRINLARYRPSRSARRILARNAGMRSTVVPFEVSEEIEMLYSTRLRRRLGIICCRACL
jgi:leucyl-tRNA---protein transferase